MVSYIGYVIIYFYYSKDFKFLMRKDFSFVSFMVVGDALHLKFIS